MAIERGPARFRLTIRTFTVTRRERGPGARMQSLTATAPRWNAVTFRCPETARCARLAPRTLTPFAKSWEINRGCTLLIDFGLPSFARNSSLSLVVIEVLLAYSGAVDRNRLAQMSNASSPYQISSVVDLAGVP